MYNFSDEAKTRVLSGKVTRAYLRVLPTETLPELIINEQNYLKDVTFEELRYIPDEGFIGGTVAKRVTGNFNNIEENFSIQDREFELYMGVDLEDGSTEYIKYGTFIVQKPEDDQVTDNTSFEALDYMIKLNNLWEDRLQYPCTIKDIFDDLISQCKLSTKVTSFYNSDFIVENNQFETGTTQRDVLKAICQIAFNWARIDEDNEIVMDFEKKDTIDEVLDENNYYNFKKNDLYGPVNVIVLRNSQVEGENITIRDEESISTYGETELVISDNPFAYTQEKRAQLIEAGRNLFGLSYTPLSMDMIGYMYLNCKDKIKAINMKGEEFDTYLFDHTIKYQGIIKDSMQSQAKTKTETKYQFLPQMIQALKRTEVLVDKANQEIQLIAKNQSDNSTRISEINVALEGITSTVANKDEVTEQINELKQTIEGTTSSIEKKGGNNIFYYSKDYWHGQTEDSSPNLQEITNSDIKQNSISGLGYILNNGMSIQKQVVKNDFYTINFLYKKLKQDAEGSILVNKEEHILESEELDEWYEKTINVEITTNSIEIEFDCNVAEGYLISDLIVVIGNEKQIWSQNPNETITDTVTIGKGIQVNSSATNTYTRIDSDGNRVYNSTTGDIVSEQTDKGTKTENLEVRKNAQINLLFIQEIDGQTWITGIGG